jgi:hypothetical protein
LIVSASHFLTHIKNGQRKDSEGRRRIAKSAVTLVDRLPPQKLAVQTEAIRCLLRASLLRPLLERIEPVSWELQPEGGDLARRIANWHFKMDPNSQAAEDGTIPKERTDQQADNLRTYLAKLQGGRPRSQIYKRCLSRNYDPHMQAAISSAYLKVA